MKKIVILTDQISEIGGITSLIHSKANYWVERCAYQIHIITTEQKNKPPYYKLNPKVQAHDLSINYDRHSSYFSPMNFMKIIINIFKLQWLLWTIKPDLTIIANHIPATFFFPILITKSKFAKEFHFSKFYLSKQKKSLFQRFQDFLESKFDYLVVLSPEESTFYKSDKVVTLPNPIAFNQEVEPTYGHRKKIAMSAGRISPVKQFDTLIDIWAIFIKKNTEWKLEIYGDGEHDYVNALKKKIIDLNLSHAIEIKPSINSIKSKMQENGLYVMTSNQECFPMVLLEALSCGLPIVSFNCPTGPRNIITTSYNGVLVDNQNNEAFVKHLQELINNEPLRISLAKNGFKSVKKYNMDTIMNLWDTEIINKI